MPANTTTYSFYKPTVGGDSNAWGGYLNSNWDDVDDLLDGTTPVNGIDIDGGSIDGTPIGAAAASTGAFTTLTASTSASAPTVTGTTSFTSPIGYFGTDDTVAGIAHLYGHAAASTDGGEVRLYAAADHDAVNDYYRLRVTSDDLVLELADGTDLIQYDQSTGVMELSAVAPTITVLTSGTSATHNLQTNTRRMRIRQLAGGGQGGGANSGGSDHGCGGGGGSGGFLEFEVDVAAAGISSFTYTIGDGGSGGGSGNDGGDGGDTTYSDGTNTLVSGGGRGGTAQTGITSMNPADGGDGGTNNVTGLVSNITILHDQDGAPGELGIGYAGNGSKGGNGGHMQGGGGKGARRGTTGGTAGGAATGYAGGGGGGATQNTTPAVAGGAGAGGLTIVEEFPY